MISGISDQDLRFGVDRTRPRIHELRQLFAVRAEFVDEHTGARENLNAVVVFVNHNNSNVLVS